MKRLIFFVVSQHLKYTHKVRKMFMATEHLSVKIHGRNGMTEEQRRRDKKYCILYLKFAKRVILNVLVSCSLIHEGYQ